MEKLIIEGGVSLRGTIAVNGSKNAALPILIASILTDKTVTLNNVPRLRDIRTTNALLRTLGCDADFTSETSHSVSITCKNLTPEAPYDLVKTMRASVLVLGPLLAKLGEAKVALPGGCAIGARPVEQHTKALEKMGGIFTLEDGYIIGKCNKLHGATISFDFPTVGGTEHIIMAATLAEGTTILHNCAKEPEIIDLANFLNACGAKITGQGTDTIQIQGVTSLGGATYSIMPDRIEAGTFLAATAITHGECIIENCPLEELAALMAKFGEMGIALEPCSTGIKVYRKGALRSIDLTTSPHPGFPTDMQAQTMALMTLAEGTSTVEETIFENRFMHVPELSRMGANIKLSGSKAVIRGVKSLNGAPVMASDLRASASLVIAGLIAKGTTQVQRIYHLDRGYENIEHKLAQVGARIQRVKE